MTYTKVYQVEESRAINVIKLSSSGLLEVRIASRDNATKYKNDLASFLWRLKSFIDIGEFKEISLRKVKDNLWENREELRDTVKFSAYTLKDDEGLSLSANVSLGADDLARSERIAKSLAEFNTGTTYCSSSNIYFVRPSDEDEQPRPIHILLNGEEHEFAITVAVTEEEYDYVLQQVRRYN